MSYSFFIRPMPATYSTQHTHLDYNIQETYSEERRKNVKAMPAIGLGDIGL
jgi:hypothetical protein